jgi:hypothetical protein
MMAGQATWNVVAAKNSEIENDQDSGLRVLSVKE